MLNLSYFQYLSLDDPKLTAYGSGVHKNDSGQKEMTKFPSRDQIVQSIRDCTAKGHEYDVLVIGLGVTGAGVALDAQTRNLSVIAVDQDDFSSGTSSRSTKLLHGGVRYLKKAMIHPQSSWSQFKLVREALHERWVIFQQSAHLTNSIRIVAPVYSWKELIFTWVQMKLYDWISFPHIHSSYYISKDTLLELYPHLSTKADEFGQKVMGAVCYFDGQMDDSRLNLAIAQTAILNGAHILNYARVVDVVHDPNGRANGAILEDKETGERIQIRAKQILIAAGAFADEVRKMDSKEAKKMLVTACGAHIVLDRKYAGSQANDGFLITKTTDKRVLFVLPWQGYTLVGTTDSKCGVTNNPRPSEKEIAYLIQHVNAYFNPENQITRRDVLSAWSGIRPLKKADDERETATISREHAIYTAKDTQIKSIVGGKWTTYRRMAQEVVDQMIAEGHFNSTLKGQFVKARTEKIQLHGQKEYNPEYAKELSTHYHIPYDVAHHLNEAYGDHAEFVLQLAEETDSKVRLIPIEKGVKRPHPYLEAEVIYTIRNEYALHPIDFLERRIRLSMLDAKAAKKALDRVIDIFAKERKWDQDRKEREMKTARGLLQISTEKIEKVEVQNAT